MKGTSAVRRNVFANYLGSAVSYLLSFVFAPIYIKLLGPEAYGLIGFFTSVRILISVVDLGMSATLTRELSRRSVVPGSNDDTADLTFSLEVVYFTLGVAAAIVVAAISPYLAANWLQSNELGFEVVSRSLVIMTIAFSLRWCSALYTAGLVGLQRQVAVNIVEVGAAVFQYAGVIAILGWLKTSVVTFFWYQAAVSLLQTVATRTMLWSALPKRTRRPRWNRDCLSGVKKFALGVSGISITSLVILQADRIILSRLMPLAQLGYYTFAANVGALLNRIVKPVNQAIAPRINQLVALGDKQTLKRNYTIASELVALIVLPVSFVLFSRAPDLLLAWTGDPVLTRNVSGVFRILLLGNALNALMNLPYSLQIAYGWTSLTLAINAGWILLMLPGIFILYRSLGVVGVAALWLTLNGIYLLVSVQIMHRRIEPELRRPWYIRGVLIPIGCSTVGAALSQIKTSTDTQLVLLVAASIVLSAGLFFLMAPDLRRHGVAQFLRICRVRHRSR